jgi:DNA repair exonuclease SbcCD ATPase subunit
MSKNENSLEATLEVLDATLETLEKSLKAEELEDDKKSEDEEEDEEETKKKPKEEEEKKEENDDLQKSIQSSILKTNEMLEELTKSLSSRISELEENLQIMAAVTAVPRSIQGLGALKKSITSEENEPQNVVLQNTPEGRSLIKGNLIDAFEKAEGDLKKSLGTEMLGFDASGNLSQSTKNLLLQDYGITIK